MRRTVRVQTLFGKKRKPTLIDQDNVVVADVYCIRCGHNLRSRLISDKCPNCLHPVSDSVFGDYLVHADRDYVRQLAESAHFVRIAAAFLGGLIAIALVVTLIAEATRRELIHGIQSVFQIIFAGAMIAPLVAAVGLATLTQRHTFAYYQARYGSRRNVIALSVATILLLALLIYGAYWFSQPISNLVLTCWAVLPVAVFMRRVGKLMARVPDKELAAYGYFACWGVFISGVALFCVLTLRSMALADKTWQDAQLGLTSLYIVGSLAFGIGGYRLLKRVEESLRKAAR